MWTTYEFNFFWWISCLWIHALKWHMKEPCLSQTWAFKLEISPNIMFFKYTLFSIGTTNFAYMGFFRSYLFNLNLCLSCIWCCTLLNQEFNICLPPFVATFNCWLGLWKQKNLETRSKNNNMSQNWDIVKFVKRIYQSHGSLKKYTIGNLTY